MTPSQQFCFDLVRAGDKDRFLAGLFAPEDKQPLLWALYAFNIEIARVRETVSDARLGEIRHQWWREALDGIYAGAPPDHPVAQELARAIAAGDLPKPAFENMIAARQFDLYDDPMPTMGDLEGYLGETSSALVQMAALVLAGEAATACAEAAGLGGVAYGLAGLLRALPLHRSRGQCYISRDLLERHGSNAAELIAGSRTAGIAAALNELRARSGLCLATARGMIDAIPSAAMPAFLHVGLTDLYLSKVGKMGIEILGAPADVMQLRRQLRLYGLARLGSF